MRSSGAIVKYDTFMKEDLARIGDEFQCGETCTRKVRPSTGIEYTEALRREVVRSSSAADQSLRSISPLVAAIPNPIQCPGGRSPWSTSLMKMA
jgi:hypothetical protein